MNTLETGTAADAAPAEREQLRCLDFYLAELRHLRDRGLIRPDAFGTVAAETEARRAPLLRRVEAAEALQRAESQAAADPAAAAALADQACQVDADWPAAWSRAVALHRAAGDLDRAISVAEQAAARFADFPVRPDDLRAERDRAASSADGLILIEEVPVATLLADAHTALSNGDDRRVLELTGQALAAEPDHLDATVLRAFAAQRGGRLDLALELYESLRRRQPENPVWTQWSTNVRRRLPQGAAPARPAPQPVTPPQAAAPTPVVRAAAPTPVVAEPAVPRVSWAQVSGEFLQDHWQKLILCLAVLLIVVSSNVGAYQLLGPQIFSPLGKCVLALVYTGMFAGFGAGLVRWGAERAGRIMLLTTLIVVPANFMLAGEMKLLADPTPGGLALLAADAAALFLLVRGVGASLGLNRGAWGLTVALFGLSAFNAAAAPGVAWPWAWQFAAFLAPAAVFLAATGWLNLRNRSDATAFSAEVTYAALGLFAFAYLSGVARTGALVLHLEPALYAVPVMAAGVATVITSRGALRFDDTPQRETWLRFGGLVLTGLAFALALTRPPFASALYSGNTLAVAAAGLVLYAWLLLTERQPAFLYLAFGALVLGYFGAFYFVVDLLREVEQAAASALGRPKLPPSFRAINGLVFNTVLAALAVWFRRVKGDDRLARHCHYLGVPFSVACGLFSTLDRTSAVICLSGYTVLYAAAVRVFAEPRVIYLAGAALAGAGYFGSLHFAGLTLAERALGASLIGLAECGTAVTLRRRGTAPAYRRPLFHVATVMAALAMAAATASALPAGPATLAAAAAFFAVALTAVIANRDEPTRTLAYLAALAGSLGYAFLALSTGNRVAGGLSPAQFAAALGSSAFGLALVGDRLAGFIGGRKDARPALSVYPAPLAHTAFAQVALTLAFIAAHYWRHGQTLPVSDHATLAAAWGLSAAALGMLTTVYPYFVVGHLSLGCGVGLAIGLVQVALQGRVTTPEGYAAAAAGYGLILLGAWEAARALAPGRAPADPEFAGGRRHPAGPRIFAAVPDFLFGLTAAAVGAAGYAWTADGPTVFTLAAGSAAVVGASRDRRVDPAAWAGLMLAVAAALCTTTWRLGWTDSVFTTASLALTAACASLALWGVATALRTRPTAAFYVEPCLGVAGLVTWAAFWLGVVGGVRSKAAFPFAAGALTVNALAFIALTTAKARPSFTYRSVLAVVLAVYIVLFNMGRGSLATAHVPGLVAVLLALGCQAVGFAGRSRMREGWERLYVRPLFRSSLVLTLFGMLVLQLVFRDGSMVAGRVAASTGLAAVALLVLVKGWPSRRWTYAVVATAVLALYQGWIFRLPPDQLVTASMVIAYQLWLVGLVVRRLEPALVRGLRLTETGYEHPVLHSAVVAAVVAAALRVVETLDGRAAAADSAGLAWNLAVFLLFMTRVYPHAAWVHGAVVLASGGVWLWAWPQTKTLAEWMPVGMGLAVGWQAAAWGARKFGDRLGRALGVGDSGYRPTFDLWSQAFFVLTLGVMAFDVTGVASISRLAVPWSLVAIEVSPRPWWAMLIAAGTGVVYLVQLGWPAPERRPLAWAGFEALVVLAVWWTGVSGSPLLARTGWDSPGYLPAATAALAAAAVGVSLGLVRRPGRLRASWAQGDRLTTLDALNLDAGLALALVAAAGTLGDVRVATALTLLTSALAVMLAAGARRWVAAGYVGGLLTGLAGLAAAAEAARRYEVGGGADRVVLAAVGLLAAVAALTLLSGWLRRRDPEAVAGVDATDLPGRAVAVALEHVALLSAVFCAAGVGFTVLLPDHPADRAAMAGVGVLAALTLLCVTLLLRWGAAWLVYLGESALLGAYLYFRWAFPLPAATDGAVLTLFGYLGFGMAEAMHRVGLGRYAGAVRRFSLLVPVVPIALALWGGPLSAVRLFLVFAAATFYGVASLRLQSRTAGCVAAVLYNAALWMLWSQVGWTFRDRPQFFLVPVGLTAILLAELNRETFARGVLNGIRGVGLTTIYLSLAVPVWQFASLGAWLTLLLLSLAGIFVGIGLRVQTFLWLGLAGFVLDVVYQLGRVGMENTLAKWGIMLALGILLVLFVALNEKKQILGKVKGYLDTARQWE